MPILKSSKKDVRRIKNRTARNKVVISKIKKLLKKIKKATPDEAKKMLPSVYSEIDKAVKNGILKKGTAKRYKSRAAAKANSISSGNVKKQA
ncbi:MAG: 30S ribosomal protein S20 [Candidatus Goldbacteria bacterium]|nr:30S ribosomal protein S20 [Candidatus Goldiibacteriota bacterium]